MRATTEIDDPTWDDIRDRDALIRRLAEVIRGELFEKDSRPDSVLIDDTIEDALVAIGDTTDRALERAVQPLPTRRELRDAAREDTEVLVNDPQGGYTGTL